MGCLPRRALYGSVDVDDELKQAHFVQRSSSVALEASSCAALPPVKRRRGVVNQTGYELHLGATCPAELPQLTSRPVVLVESRVHLFGVTIGAVTIQGDADMPDEFTQTSRSTQQHVPARCGVCCSRRNAKPCTRDRATAAGRGARPISNCCTAEKPPIGTRTTICCRANEPCCGHCRPAWRANSLSRSTRSTLISSIKPDSAYASSARAKPTRPRIGTIERPSSQQSSALVARCRARLLGCQPCAAAHDRRGRDG